MQTTNLVLALYLLPCCFAQTITLFVTEVSGNVEVNVSGKLTDLSGLSAGGTPPVYTQGEIELNNYGVVLNGDQAAAMNWIAPTPRVNLAGCAGFPPNTITTYPATGDAPAVGIIANVFGIPTGTLLTLPDGYTANTQLRGSITIAGESFASLGFIPDTTCSFEWDTGASAQRIVIQAAAAGTTLAPTPARLLLHPRLLVCLSYNCRFSARSASVELLALSVRYGAFVPFAKTSEKK